MKNILKILEEFSVPLIVGIVLAIVWANINYQTYYLFLHKMLLICSIGVFEKSISSK